MTGNRLTDSDYNILSDDWRKSWKTINGDIQTSIAELQGKDAIQGLVAAFLANEAVDSKAVAIAELTV